MKLFFNKISRLLIFISSCLFISLLINSQLFAEPPNTGFRKKGYYFEYRYGLPYFHSGSLVDSIYDKNKLSAPYYVAEDDALVYFYSRSNANRPSISSRAHSILFEYGLTEKIGVGFNVHTELYKADNFSTSNYNQNFLYSALLYGSDVVNPIVLTGLNKRYVALKEKTSVMNLGILDFNLGYHFSPGKKWDPYVRVGLGIGKDLYSSSYVTRLIGSVGTRYFFTKNFYLVGEFQLAQQEIFNQSKPGFLEKFAPTGVLREAYVRVGVGMSPGFEKSEEKITKKEPEVTPPAKEEKIVEKVVEPTPAKKIDSLVPEMRKVAVENNLLLEKRDGKLVITSLNEGLFDSGSDKINSNGENSLRNLAKVLKKLDNVNFTIEGHTDNLPLQDKTKYETNKELSLGRAESVELIFISEKIPVSKLKTKGYGDTRPVKPNNTAEGRKANRRIEIITDENLSEIPQLEGLLEEK